MSAEGWVCPTCKRGVAPTEKTCDHGHALFWPTPPNYLQPVPVPTPYYADCGCHPMAVCANTACPRRVSGVSIPLTAAVASGTA